MLTFIIKSGKNKWGKTKGIFKCDCGKEKEIVISDFKSHKLVSCGCLKSERIRKFAFKHGMSKNCPEYKIWRKIKERCDRPQDKSYKNYGGRGIKISEEWRDFTVFYKDMGPRPNKEYSIE